MKSCFMFLLLCFLTFVNCYLILRLMKKSEKKSVGKIDYFYLIIGGCGVWAVFIYFVDLACREFGGAVCRIFF